MPELGKATYELVFDTTQVANIDRAETQVVGATDRMDASIVGLEGAVKELSSQVGILGTAVTTSFNEAAVGAEEGAAKVEAASAATGAAAEKAAAKSEAAWVRFGRVGGGIGKLLEIGAAFEFVKGGFEWLKTAQEGQMALAGAIHATKNAAGVSIESLTKLSDKITELTGNTRGENFQMEQMLLRFRNLRNVGPGTIAIFDRAAMMVTNIAAVTHRSTQMIALALGKVLNDPANNLNSLGRAGIRFNKAQQEMIKTIESGKKSFQGYTGVLGAQLYVLDQLRSYDHAAEDRSHSLRVEMLKVRDSFEKSSASILQSFIPALRTLAGVLTRIAGLLAHHTHALRLVIIAYIAAKGAAFTFVKVMQLFKFAQWTAGFLGMAAGADAESAAAKGAAASNTLLGSTFLSMIPVIGAAVGAYLILRNVINSVKEAQDRLDSALGHYAGGSPLHEAEMMFANRRTQNYIKAGMSPADARKRAITDTQKQFNDSTWTPQSGGSAAMKSDAYNAKMPTVLADPTKKKKKKALHGAGLLPIPLQIALAKAGLTKSNKDDIVALDEQKKYLEGLLKKAKPNSARALAILQELDSVQSQLDVFASSIARKNANGKYKGIIPFGLEMAYQKALQTKSLKDDEKVLRQQEKYLETALKNHKLSSAKQIEYMKALTEVKKKLAEAIKRETATQQALSKQMQAFVDTRGSFFSEFASSIFHGQTGGGLMMGSGPSAMSNTPMKVLHFAKGGLVPPFGMDRHGARNYSVLGSNGAFAPMRKDISKWLDQYTGRGLSPAAAHSIAQWWTQNFGKIAKGYATGGRVPGSGISDSVPAMLTPGELVLNARQQKRLAGLLALATEHATATLAGGGGDRNMHYTQHNNFNEIPQDRFALARQMQRAAQAV